MTHRFSLAIGLLLALGFSSCSEEHDLHVDLHDPVQGAIFAPGDEIHCDFEIHSSSELQRYVIEIHPEGSSSWNHFEESPVSGKNVDIHKDVVVPAGTSAGDYHLSVWAFNQAGDSAKAEVDIKIEP
jgi:hypothetical protein